MLLTNFTEDPNPRVLSIRFESSLSVLRARAYVFVCTACVCAIHVFHVFMCAACVACRPVFAFLHAWASMRAGRLKSNQMGVRGAFQLCFIMCLRLWHLQRSWAPPPLLGLDIIIIYEGRKMLGVSLSARELERQSPTRTHPQPVSTTRSIVAPKIGKGRDARNNDHTPHQPLLDLIWGLSIAVLWVAARLAVRKNL